MTNVDKKIASSAVVHDDMSYDLELDVTRASPAELAEQLHAAF